ncbi:DsbA family protein [Patulibacter defluvii]|uniref:DsbA family protein n=1 Tax=Patulibacter defluvii TaxID=3095358 RepID=UPI002A765407|nr:DsbA family protein [Patulibacter sp. DM4]
MGSGPSSDAGTLRPDDHVSGSPDGPLVIVYGDAGCPRCQQGVRFLRGAPVRLVWRHLVLRARGPRPRALAAALEAAARQDGFWPLLDRLLAEPGRTEDPDLWAHCEQLGLDVARFDRDRRDERTQERIGRDLAEGLSVGAVGTPAILVGGRVDHGIPDDAWVAALLADPAR